MPIQSKVKIEGFKSPIPGVFSRVIGANINTQTGQTILKIRDWADAEAGQKVLDKFETPIPDPAYDSKNPRHVEIWEAAGRPSLTALDAHGEKWRPTLGLTQVEYKWDGEKTAEKPLQDREIVLPIELSLAVAAQALEGATPREPANALEAMTAQLYLAAMATGKFEEPVSVAGLEPLQPGL